MELGGGRAKPRDKSLENSQAAVPRDGYGVTCSKRPFEAF